MRTYKLEVNIDDDHQLSMNLPDNFPTGPAEVVVLAKGPARRQPVPLAGVLDTGEPLPEGDPIGDALDELRTERAELLARRADRLR